MAVLHVRKGDTVKVLTGKDRGKTGKVLVVLPDKGRVVVEGVAFIKRHTRPNPQRNIKGGIVEREASVHASNLMVVCGECSKPVRVAHRRLQDGQKVRVCRKCGGALDRR
jgi:large subunit ribosomal protein L24